jgi:uncharacterized repeat protein (TIGR01451 family)
MVLALLALPVSPSSADALRQASTPVRPTVTPAAPAESIAETPSIAGYVWVNGDVFVPAVGIPVRFVGDGFELAVLTDVNGYYQFESVGQDVGFLNVAGNGASWKASVKDIALSPRPGLSLRANFSASQGTPEKGSALLSVSVTPDVFGAGQIVTVTVKATNNTDQQLSRVWLTHLLPDGLSASSVSVSRGDAQAVGQLTMANLGDFAPGDSASFTIVAAAPGDGGPKGNFSAVASMISHEGVAVQASASMRGTGGPVTLPVTGMDNWLIVAGMLLAVVIVGVHQARRRSVQI